MSLPAGLNRWAPQITATQLQRMLHRVKVFHYLLRLAISFFDSSYRSRNTCCAHSHYA